ncbi:hypothetical protein HG536_0B01000 [Torulaspora globosa]|uniref:GDP/GTP exchange factor Sec2 N-terminal domain-containing protein n=1 Tax=Torulaspora globosa TaxID=48254 RepID=A0A7G3ZCK3_9SACH|nr:uncharacterized protein HG536_0B01000 [Torulaspora globosa]QLL31239.1 hypothetical protein HG536_0B01000 [Torulaspora globosa]
MEGLSEESERVSVQISSLSTQLIESIEKQSQLEERLNKANRTIQIQKSIVDQYEEFKLVFDGLERKYNGQTEEIEKLKEELAAEKELRSAAQKTVEELNTEIEDLTASLFNEANKMVATARKEGHALEVENTKLTEQLREKDSILEILNLQVKNLKKILQNVEEESMAKTAPHVKPSTTDNDKSGSTLLLNRASTSSSSKLHEQLSGPIYSPNIRSIRYDLDLYKEFMKFIAVLPRCETLKEASSSSKLLRRLINDEIQPILRLDNASGLGWIVRRTLMSLMMEGLVVVEPLSGINENFQYGSPTLKSSEFRHANLSNTKDNHLFNFPLDSPPIAVHDKCSFCSEARDDVLEHARMYVLKTQNKLEDGSLVITNSFPLCRYCLLKVRQTCEIFAFLRSLKLGTWNLEKVTLTSVAKDEGRATNGGSRDEGSPRKEGKSSHRLSVIGGTTKTEPQVDTKVELAGSPTSNIQRAWLQLCKLRSALHWTHIGIWSIDDSIGQKIGPLVTPINEEGDAGDISPIVVGGSNFSLGKADSEDFTIKKGDDGEPTESETFDFEGKNASPATSVHDVELSINKGEADICRPASTNASEERDTTVRRVNDKESSQGLNVRDSNIERSPSTSKLIESTDAENDRSNTSSGDEIGLQQNNFSSFGPQETGHKEPPNDCNGQPETNDEISNDEEAYGDALDNHGLDEVKHVTSAQGQALS